MAVDASRLQSELSSICQNWRELDPIADASLAVDGQVPALWCEPTSADELAAVVRLANERKAGVLPRGGGTRMHLGYPPRSADLLLSTRGLNRIVEYEPADLTVTVEAGIRLGELQSRLGQQGQLLALDPPSARDATIGGIVASNASGPLRLRYGSARDLVIGTRVANADGTLTKAGGRVVKNVAGYDLNKLYTGSLGTVGVIVELSFKLHPLPQQEATVVAIFPNPELAAEVSETVLRSPLGPTAIEIVNGRAAATIAGGLSVPSGGCAMFVLVGGFDKAVGRVADEIAALSSERGRAERIGDEESGRYWAALRELGDASDPRRPVLKVAVPPALAIEAYRRLEVSLERAGFDAALVCRPGVGIVLASLGAASWEPEALQRLANVGQEVRAFAAEQQGSLVLESGPSELKRYLDPWGEVGPSVRLMRALKEKLDPAGTLNAGRFVGGI